jgi:imidazolonepropionase-like amidohydrolase
MPRPLPCLALAAALGASAPRLPAAERAAATAVRAGRLLDVAAGRLRTDQVVLIADGRIVAVGPSRRVAIPRGAAVIDLGDAVVVPGLIDAHTHLAWAAPEGAPTPAGQDEARATLEAGFTTVRNLGSTGRADLLLRDAIREGRV